MSSDQIKTGIYRHYKGKLYEVIALVHHSETVEELVLYKALYETEFGMDSLWVRPKKMFFETIEVDGKKVPRFEFIEEKKNN
jgi:hypothetical protein